MATTLTTTCCITGGGPAGMMLGWLLARAGLQVMVLEKHADFLRDFRGDTIHPSTLQLMHELGVLDAFLALPHQKVERLTASVQGHAVTIADFTHLKTACPALVLMPQWDFLDFVADQARRHAGFTLRRSTEATGLLQSGGRVTGVRAYGPEGELEITADLVVAADGRHSTLRPAAGLPVDDHGAPIDVLWFRLPRTGTDAPGDAQNRSGGYAAPGGFLAAIDRGDYWQCGYVIAKGGFERLKADGLDALKARVGALAPPLATAVAALASWDEVKLLTVQIDRMPTWWRPGLLCIGDAAHAMSPIGGVGINLAIQDAVAAANRLAAPLRERRAGDPDLAAVQRRREFAVRVTQQAQIAVQDRIMLPLLSASSGTAEAAGDELPWALQLLAQWPALQRIPARLVGMGLRPEHVRTPEVH